MRAAKAVATPGSRRAGSDATRRLGTEARKSPSSGDLITESFPARDLADSLSAFAAVDFSAEKNMLENAGLTPPTRAILKAAKTPVSGRRALGDVANLTTLRPGTTKSPNEGDAVDDWSVSLNNSVSPPPTVTENAPVVPKSPAEILAALAKDAAAGLRRASPVAESENSLFSPPAADVNAATKAMLTPVSFKCIEPNALSSRKNRSVKRARVMATHAARVMDTPSGGDVHDSMRDSHENKNDDKNGSPVDRVMLHYTEGKASDELLDALEHELRQASAASVSFTFREDDDEENVEKSKPAEPSSSKKTEPEPVPAATPARASFFDFAKPKTPSSGGSPFVRLVAEDTVEEKAVDADESGNGSGGNTSGGQGVEGTQNTGSNSNPAGTSTGFGNFGAGGFGSDDLFSGGGDGDDSQNPDKKHIAGHGSISTLPSNAGVTLANALGKWREAVSIAQIEAEAKKVQTELAEIMREQAADCDDEVNKLTDENDVLTAALAATTATGIRARWRLAAKAAVLTKKCEERRAEARKLRTKARKLEQQLLKVEEHITSAATDFDRLRGRLTESTKETERARAGERDARVRLAEAQAVTAEALSRNAASTLRKRDANENENVAPDERIDTHELKKQARQKILQELRSEMRDDVRLEFGDILRKQAELEAIAEYKETALRVTEASSASKTLAATIDGLLRSARSKQMKQVATARREATIRARENLEAACEAGVDTLRLGADQIEGGVDPLELVSLIAVHALERCEAHPHGDGARAFYRAARRVELAARACQPEYKAGVNTSVAEHGSGSKYSQYSEKSAGKSETRGKRIKC